MTLQLRIESAMREAMLARDIRRTGTLRMAMAAFQNRRIELGRDLTDEDVIDVLSKQMKQRRESIEHFKAAGRDSMVQVEEEESADHRRVPAAAALRGRAARPGERRHRRDRRVHTGRPGKVMGRLAPQIKDAPTARRCPTWCERSSAADPMFIPRTLAETEGAAGEGLGPRPDRRRPAGGQPVGDHVGQRRRGQVNLAVGDVAQSEIRAPISRSFVSESQTNAAREEAADQVATVYVPIAPLADILDQQLRAYDAVVGGITRTLEQRDAGALIRTRCRTS